MIRFLDVKKLPLRDATVEYVPEFLTKEEADFVFETCSALPFSDVEVKVYGKMRNQPRKTCYIGSSSYSYSGATLDAHPIPKDLEFIFERLEDLSFGKGYNGALCNMYRDGNDYISPHSDNESVLDKKMPICGLSLGAVRHFDLSNTEEKHRIDLEHGSLIVMHPGCQTFYKHSVPVQKTVKIPRINLTFRKSR